MFKRIDHIEIVPLDMEKSMDFYTDILGFTIKERHKVNVAPLKEVVYLELDDTVLEILSVENPVPRTEQPWQAGYRMMAIEVDNMDDAVRYLKDKGLKITWGPVSLGKSKRAEIKDPDGVPIELREW